MTKTSVVTKRVYILLAPAKEMDFITAAPILTQTVPNFLHQTTAIVSTVKKSTAAKLSADLSCSSSIAATAHSNYQSWSPTAPTSSLPALFAFSGVAFKKLDARSLTPLSIQFAATNLLLFDPLYGILQGSDIMQPYRLELSHKLAIDGEETSLAIYWKTRVTPFLVATLPLPISTSTPTVLLDASSQEYGKSLLVRPALTAAAIQLVTCDFLTAHNKASSVHAKQSRGLFARYCCENTVGTLEEVMGFDKEGYECVSIEEEEGGHKRITFNRGSVPVAKTESKKRKVAGDCVAQTPFTARL